MSPAGSPNEQVVPPREVGPSRGALNPKLHNTLSYSVAALIFALLAPWQKPQAWCVVALWVFHFARRSLEALMVHRYSGKRVPPTDYLVEYAYYWGFAIWIAFGIEASGWQLPGAGVTLTGLGIFLLGEAGNGWAHVKLRKLRQSPGDRHRSIPEGGLFEWVSCPHYLFEILSWCGFALLTRVWGAYAFLLLGSIIVSSYAVQRHKNYRAQFDGEQGRRLYPARRKAIIPFIL